jgi:hypothetical protein
MPSASTPRSGDDADSSPIYLANLNDLRETGRAIGISLLGVDPAGPAIFVVEGDDFLASWNRWLSDTFERRLGEPFIEIFSAAGTMRNRRIAVMDREIDDRLTEVERRRSLAAATPFLEGTTQIRRLPQWTKFLEKIRNGDTPGHVISLFALRSAVFHLPLLPALVSYLYFEWKSGAGTLENFPGERLTPAVFQSEFPEGIEAAKRLFESGTGGGSRLQSI